MNKGSATKNQEPTIPITTEDLEHFKKNEEKIVTIQSGWRGHKVRKELDNGNNSKVTDKKKSKYFDETEKEAVTVGKLMKRNIEKIYGFLK